MWSILVNYKSGNKIILHIKYQDVLLHLLHLICSFFLKRLKQLKWLAPKSSSFFKILTEQIVPSV